MESSCAIRGSNSATDMLRLSSHNLIDRIPTETDLLVEDQGPFLFKQKQSLDCSVKSHQPPLMKAVILPHNMGVPLISETSSSQKQKS